MAYLNPFVESQNKKNRESYKGLLKFISSKDKDGKISEWYPAAIYISEMEDKIKKMEGEIKEYREFFNKLDSFLPQRPSTSRIIG